MLCQREEREAGRPYPRTCPTCKLGPCQKDQPRTLIGENAIIAAKDAEITRLTAELTALRAGQDALVAAACMSMRDRCADMVEREGHGLHVAIRHAPIPTDATAALDAMLRAERNKVRREAAAVCRRHISGWMSHNAILAMIETEGK